MTVNLSALAGAGQQFFNDSGVILSGGKLYSYAAGTTTPQTTYTSASGSTAHTNPIILNSAGRVATGEIWLTAGSNYKFVLYNSTNVLIATWDNITGINGTGIASNASNVAYDPAGSSAVATTVQTKLRETVSVKDFGAVGNGVTDDVDAIDSGIAYLKSIGGGTLYFPTGTYAISTDSINGIKIQDASGITLCGAGQSATTIKSLSGNGGHTLSIFDSNNITIENLTVDGNRLAQTSSGHGIRGESITGLTIQNVTVQQAYSYGIGLQDGIFKNVRIQNVNIEYTGADGMDCKNKDSDTGESNENLFISNVAVKQWGLRNDLTEQAGIDMRGAWELSNVFVREPGAITCHGIRFRFGESDDLANGLGGHKSKLANFYIDLGTTTTSGIGLSVNAPFVTVTNGYIKGGSDSLQVISGGTTVTKDVSISNVYIDSHADEGIFINGNDVLISNCVVTGGNEGVRTVGLRTKLIGCVMDGCDEGFVAQTGGDNLLLQGCTIINSVTRAGRIDSGVTGVQILSGIFKDNPSSNAISGATFADVINNVTNAITFTPYKSFVLASSAVAIPLTGTVATTPLATISIPANRMGLNGYFVVSTVWSCTNNANRKSYILQFGSTVSDIDLANSASYSDQRTIQNRNNASSQVIFAGTGGFGTSTTALGTASQNTTTSINLIINGDLANAGDTMTLEAYRVELVYIP